MTATCIHLEETKATVVLRPSWLARLFGARTFSVSIARAKQGSSEWGWRMSATNRLLHESLSVDRIILEALDFRPVSQLPEARSL